MTNISDYTVIAIAGTRNTSCAISCIETKAFLTTKCFMMVGKTIVTNGVLDNINIRVFKLPRLANFDLYKKLLNLPLNFMIKC